jgi:hypothetical protein
MTMTIRTADGQVITVSTEDELADLFGSCRFEIRCDGLTRRYFLNGDQVSEEEYNTRLSQVTPRRWPARRTP